MSETELETAVLELAALLGYLRFHPLPAQRQSGRWVTAQRGDTGYPDLTLAGNGRVIFAELKAAKGRVSEAQQVWLDALWRAGQEAYVWRPADWIDGTVERVLRNGQQGNAALGRLVRSA